MKRVATLAYLSLVHIALAVLLIRTDAVPRAMARIGLTEPGRAPVELAHSVFQQRRDPIVPEGAAVFLGDSITHGYVPALVEPMSVNFGIGQQTAAQLARELPRYGSLKRAGRIYLMIGTNDVLQGRANALPERYESILANLPENVPLVWSTVMPLADAHPGIETANAAVRTLCARRPDCTIVDVHAAMTRDDGSAKPGLLLDRAHPSPKGYAIWTETLLAAR